MIPAPGEHPLHGKRRGRAHGLPCPAPTPDPDRAGERVVRTHRLRERSAAISRPTSISPVPTRANYRVNHCARGSRGEKERE